ncbi:hypothetical protein LX36DRAFT_382925 [Colletotrichum falcatum]|nr:hypothetical protein LX36DRAFT_382925 [Colletotrichum falcatum]
MRLGACAEDSELSRTALHAALYMSSPPRCHTTLSPPYPRLRLSQEPDSPPSLPLCQHELGAGDLTSRGNLIMIVLPLVAPRRHSLKVGPAPSGARKTSPGPWHGSGLFDMQVSRRFASGYGEPQWRRLARRNSTPRLPYGPLPSAHVPMTITSWKCRGRGRFPGRGCHD